MEKQVLAEAIMRMVEGGDPTQASKFEMEDFMVAVSNARAYKIKTDYWEAFRNMGERVVNEAWLKTFQNVAVDYDGDTDTYYSVLPTKVMWLPRGVGLYHVSRMQNIQNPFAPMATGEVFMFSRILNLKNDTTIYYSYDDDNIYYRSFDPAIKKVLIQLVPFEDDDIPDEFAFEIRELVVNHFLKGLGIFTDKTNDNNPNVRQPNAKQ